MMQIDALFQRHRPRQSNTVASLDFVLLYWYLMDSNFITRILYKDIY